MHLQVQNYEGFPMTAFLGIGFTLHRYIIEAVKDLEERLFYIKRCAEERYLGLQSGDVMNSLHLLKNHDIPPQGGESSKRRLVCKRE